MTSFTPVEGLAGGAIIGLAVVIWLGLYGRVTGISGILGGALFERDRSERGWRTLYLVGLIAGAGIYLAIRHQLPGTYFDVDLQAGWPVMLAAGLLVGFGTRLGHGCTSGHGVCGLARLSGRSLAATATFMLFGFFTASLLRHALGV
jgi:uncharacterized membrane protein YedE/YeeE